MLLPVVRGVIERRILVNYQADPEVLARLLPAPFRPKVVHGRGVVGVCLIRMAALRPRGLPALFGSRSENAAHRFAVEWDENGQVREGVYIPRRDTSSRWMTWSGGRLFPAILHHARFHVDERNDRYEIDMSSDDRTTRLHVVGRVTEHLPATSLLPSLREASDFFERGSLGYAATSRTGQYHGLELCSRNWRVSPLAIDTVESSFFADDRAFPRGSIALDSGLLMRGIDHEWHAAPGLCCVTGAAAQN